MHVTWRVSLVHAGHLELVHYSHSHLHSPPVYAQDVGNEREHCIHGFVPPLWALPNTSG